MRMLSESSIVRSLAEQVFSRVSQRVIKVLQHQKDSLLSGDDSSLTNRWEELCVQIQGEQSFHWDAYEELIAQLVAREIELLQPHEQEAIWLQTPAGESWDNKDEQSREECPVRADDIVEYLKGEIYRTAGDWSNRRIRDYLER